MFHMKVSAGPAWVVKAKDVLSKRLSETVTTPVSSKGEKYPWQREFSFGWFHPECCECVYIKEDASTYYSPKASWHHSRDKLIAEGWKEYPSNRCAMHESQKKKWQRARDIFVTLDELRMNEEFEHLRFTTLTRKKWNRLVPMDQLHLLEEIQEEHKKSCARTFRNFRNRNAWWQSRRALGQYWPECKHNAEWNGVEFVGIRLHFHVHCILVSEFLDNRPIRDCCDRPCNCPKKFQGAVTGDSKFHKEWGGIVDVRSVKDWKVKYDVKGETREGCGRKACMRYLIKYITKADNWKSVKIGKWRKEPCSKVQSGD
jgi:hypothetical protein